MESHAKYPRLPAHKQRSLRAAIVTHRIRSEGLLLRWRRAMLAAVKPLRRTWSQP